MKKLFSLCLRLSGMLGRFLFIVYIAKHLPLEEAGAFGLLVAASTYMSFLVGLDFYAYANRELIVTGLHKRKKIIKNQFIVYIPGYALTIIISYLYIAEKIDISVLMLSVLMVLEHITTEVSRIFTAIGMHIYSAVASFLRTGGWCWGVMVGHTVIGSDVGMGSIVLSWVFADILVLCMFVFYLMSCIEIDTSAKIDWHWIKRGLMVSLIVLGGTVALRGIYIIDRVALESVEGLSAVGVYSLYSAISASIIGIIDAAIFSLHLSPIVNLANKEDWSALKREVRVLMVHTAAALTIIVVILFVSIDYILYWVDKPEYIDSKNVFIFLTASTVLFVISNIPSYLLYAVKCDKELTASHVSAALIFVVIICLSGQGNGMTGIALSQMMAVALMLALKTTIAYRRVGAKLICSE